jgi:hypothetical protein
MILEMNFDFIKSNNHKWYFCHLFESVRIIVDTVLSSDTCKNDNSKSKSIECSIENRIYNKYC